MVAGRGAAEADSSEGFPGTAAAAAAGGRAAPGRKGAEDR